MKYYDNPSKPSWNELCQRPTIQTADLDQVVSEILQEVKIGGDQAIRSLTRRYDQVNLESLKVEERDLENAKQACPDSLKEAIRIASANIAAFHKAQVSATVTVETMPGVTCWQKSVGIEKVGLYIPGGTAPLLSTILMLGIPAKLAGCKEIILCTPPNKEGNINAAILYTAQSLGINNIFKVGGAQSIAAMAYGTETIPKVYKIFGPGNQYVTKAKELVQLEGTAIDLPAGPSELLIIGDANSHPTFIAADLLSQAEHGADSQVILLSDDAELIKKSMDEVNKQLASLPRKDIAIKALENSKAILFDDMETCIKFSNQYAPEHLIIAAENNQRLVDNVVNAGSVFLGPYTCESAGDYASGTNHTLPTNGHAKNHSGVSVDSFVKKISYQKISEQGIKNLASTIETLAEAEELFAHKNAVTLRIKALQNG